MSLIRFGYRYWDGLSAGQEAMPERIKSCGGSALTGMDSLAGRAYGYGAPPVTAPAIQYTG